MRTGRTFPCLSWVRALNCLQNSIILIPFEPRAGPMGGAGLACPPLHWSLTKAVISFAIIKFLVLTSASGRLPMLMILLKNFFGSAKVKNKIIWAITFLLNFTYLFDFSR